MDGGSLSDGNAAESIDSGGLDTGELDAALPELPSLDGSMSSVSDAEAPEPMSTPSEPSTTPPAVDAAAAGSCLGWGCPAGDDVPLRPALSPHTCGQRVAGSWGAEMPLHEIQGRSSGTQIAGHYDGGVSVVWLEIHDEMTLELYARRRSSSGQWGEIEHVGAVPHTSTQQTRLTLGSNVWGDLVVTFYGNAILYAAIYDSVTQAWSGLAERPLNPSDELFDPAEVQVAMDAYGHAYVASTTAPTRIARASVTDKVWSTESFDLTPLYSTLSIAANQQGQVMLLWQDPVGIVARSIEGGILGEPEQLSASSESLNAYDTDVKVIAAPDGNFVAYWQYSAELSFIATFDAADGEWSEPVEIPRLSIGDYDGALAGALRADGSQMWILEGDDIDMTFGAQYDPGSTLWGPNIVAGSDRHWREIFGAVGECLHGVVVRSQLVTTSDVDGWVTLADHDFPDWLDEESVEALDGNTWLAQPFVDHEGRVTLAWIQDHPGTEYVPQLYVKDWR